MQCCLCARNGLYYYDTRDWLTGHGITPREKGKTQLKGKAESITFPLLQNFLPFDIAHVICLYLMKPRKYPIYLYKLKEELFFAFGGKLKSRKQKWKRPLLQQRLIEFILPLTSSLTCRQVRSKFVADDVPFTVTKNQVLIPHMVVPKSKGDLHRYNEWQMTFRGKDQLSFARVLLLCRKCVYAAFGHIKQSECNIVLLDHLDDMKWTPPVYPPADILEQGIQFLVRGGFKCL